MVKVAFCDFYARNAVMGFESLTVNTFQCEQARPQPLLSVLIVN